MDQRLGDLARILVEYSVRLQKGERILITLTDHGLPLARQVIREAYRVGGLPFLQINRSELLRAWLQEIQDEALTLAASYEVARMRDMQAFIGIRGPDNLSELSDVPPARIRAYQKLYTRPINDVRIPHTKWCVLRYPSPALAQSAGMSLEAFSDFYYRVCCLDYARMSRAMDELVRVLDSTDEVRIVGPGTDLRFSIKGIPAIKCAGEMNIPDGEVFTAPVRDSLNGRIAFNTPAEEGGFTFQGISFVFERGRIVEAQANDSARLNGILDTDKGARYVGEFALGVNPHIEKPMKEALFDEKIKGSFHLTPGQAYDEADNGNRSAIHWDLVCIQRPEYGGGEIYFDGRLARKDGRFVLPGLDALNPEHLI